MDITLNFENGDTLTIQKEEVAKDTSYLKKYKRKIENLLDEKEEEND